MRRTTIILLAMFMKPSQARLDERTLETGDRIKCPFCAELIRRVAKVRPHCQRNFSEPPKRAVPASVRRDWAKADLEATGRREPKPPKM